MKTKLIGKSLVWTLYSLLVILPGSCTMQDHPMPCEPERQAAIAAGRAYAQALQNAGDQRILIANLEVVVAAAVIARNAALGSTSVCIIAPGTPPCIAALDALSSARAALATAEAAVAIAKLALIPLERAEAQAKAQLDEARRILNECLQRNTPVPPV